MKLQVILEPSEEVSNLMNGGIERFSIDKLVKMIVKAGMQIKVEVINIAA